jgi:type VI secretion system protein ImpK
MSENDDPFGFSDNDSGGRTVVKPMPGGVPGPARRPADGGGHGEPPGSSPPTFPPSTPWPLSTGGGLNPIERAASSLLMLMSKLSISTVHSDPDTLRGRVTQEIRVFENNARMVGVTPENLYVARYLLCTAIDEAVLNTPWGARSNWDKQSLLITFHKEAQGGVRFFQLTKQMLEDPRGNIDLLELIYLCLSLGYRGKYRHSTDGPANLDAIRQQLHREIRQQRGDFDQNLSPHWQGEAQDYRPLTSYVPMWVMAASLAFLLLLVYAGLKFKLVDISAPAFDAIAAIQKPELPHRAATAQRPPLYVPEPPRRKSLAKLLASDISAGLLTVDEDQLRSRVVVRGDGLFPSGSARVKQDYVDLLRRIAAALEEFPGKVLVTGHSDNIPIRTLKFPSNHHLSRARASSVLDILVSTASDPARFEADGRGDREPLVPNDSKANRALNRRVEVMLMHHAAQGPGT